MPKIIYQDSESITIDASDLPVIKLPMANNKTMILVDSSLKYVKEQMEWLYSK